MNKIFRKADEMEMAINLKAARNAWAFLIAAVMVYSIIEFTRTGELPLLFLLGTVSGVIFWFNGLTKQSDEDEEYN